jgi:hypothetical protein
MAEVGHSRALDALLKRLETVPASEQDALLSGLDALRAPGVITYLWQRTKHSAVSAPARVVSLRLLRALGEEAEPDHPEQYLPKPLKLAKAPQRVAIISGGAASVTLPGTRSR